MKIADIRRQYDRQTLSIEDLAGNPIEQLNAWLKEVIELAVPDPTAMTIATVDGQGQPSQRIVLCKDIDERGLVFYTNTESRKARELASNPRISAHFPWHFIERQVKICGQVEALSSAEVTRYFLSRPKASQLAAWASAQSRPVSTRTLLMEKFAQVKRKFADGEVPLPSFWGGYRIIPHSFEFWQGGQDRLHDSFVYLRDSAGHWSINRLMP